VCRDSIARVSRIPTDGSGKSHIYQSGSYSVIDPVALRFRAQVLLQNNLFGIKPRTGRHGDRLQLLYLLLYGPHIDALLQDNEEELDSHVWFDKPWRMPAVKAWAAILHLAARSEGIGTGMFLADLKALVDASSAPHGITTHELDARAEGVLKVCDKFTSASALKDFMRSCLRAEAIKSVAARGDKIVYAHKQANNFLITNHQAPRRRRPFPRRHAVCARAGRAFDG